MVPEVAAVVVPAAKAMVDGAIAQMNGPLHAVATQVVSLVRAAASGAAFVHSKSQLRRL
jgi:hypothetical protein